jgi:hypothetical protein
MSSSRPKLMLDEQSFQDMLAAAFTIQEHNTRRKKDAPPPARACGQCGAPLPDNDIDNAPLCARCTERSAAEPRPGEELQRKWASLWLMSQEQGLWPERTPESKTHAGAEAPSETMTAEVAARRFPEALAIPIPAQEEEEEEISDPVEVETYRERPSTAPTALRILPDVSELASDIHFNTDFDSPAEEASGAADEEAIDAEPAVVPWSLPDLRLKLRFHRADLYLVAAIVISTFAMIWVLSATPAPDAHHKPHLRLWERALISMGLAEAPEAPTANRGNPNISVWVDPKTALYYCVGEELYGKAPGGHVTTQREAQLDQFEPAGRAACE